MQDGYDVEVVLSRTATSFIVPESLQCKVHLHDATMDDQEQMLHISLAKKADLILIAPASANTFAKLAGGSADCLLSTICLATKAPIMLVPAMNKEMWDNKFVQANVQKLQSYGVLIAGPGFGAQACGDFGYGRMLEPDEILEHVRALSAPKLLEGKRIVITAGPTREKIDPVRFLSNYSSGKMGYAIVNAAIRMGAEVVLISGHTSLTQPHLAKYVSIETADEMLEASLKEAANADIFIGTAAVADYKPATFHKNKIKKSAENIDISLKRNTDIITTIKNTYPKLFCVGFAAETSDIQEYGRKKLKAKKLDMIAINDVSDNKVFSQDHNELHIVSKDETYTFLERSTKDSIAEKLLRIICQNIG